MAVPKKVKIGPYTYAVDASAEGVEWAQKREAAAGNKCLLDGYISFRHEKIVVNTKDCNATNVKYALAHEVVHGILNHLGYAQEWEVKTGGEDYEEGFVTRFASAWLDVVRANPGLVAFLTET